MTSRLDSAARRSRIAPIAAMILAAVCAGPAGAQVCPPALEGAWTGTLPAGDLLRVELQLGERSPGVIEARLRSAAGTETVPVWSDGTRWRFQSLVLPLAFDGAPSADSGVVGGFLSHGSSVIRMQLPAVPGSRPRAWSGTWTPLGVEEDDPRFDLYVGDDGEGGVGGYFFFRDDRLPGLSGYGMICTADTVTMYEQVLGLRFTGRFASGMDQWALTATGPGGSAPITFRRMRDGEIPPRPDEPLTPPRALGQPAYGGGAPEQVDDGWQIGTPTELGLDTAILGAMVRAIAEGTFPRTHSVLVARRGRLAVEEYFYGYGRDTWHDMRSASKTVTSTLIGLAIRDGDIPDASARALSFFPRYHRYAAWDPRKADITVRDLLTMSSGLDANDSDPRSPASEVAYQSQRAQPDWVKLALDAPMIADPGTRLVYGGANPLILGGILAAAADEPVEWFAHRTLFGPLGIERYRFLVDPTGLPYMGGGLHLRPRDMLKYGQLYLNGGVWQGTRILPESWIAESWGRYGRLEPLDRNGHQYGYLWWHHRYEIDGRTIETVEARGNGGQYVFVVPALDLVVVITAGNYRGGLRMTRQPEEILRRYLLPSALASEDR
jgi:CubicO group peptidase (beta-lactamase class C family)